MKIKQFLFSHFFIFSTFVGVVQLSHAMEIPTAPSCNTDLAVASLKEKLGEPPISSQDGHVPWPRVLGTWIAEDRDLHVSVQSLKINGVTAVQIEVRSLCTGNLLGQGVRVISAQDHKRSGFRVALKNSDGTKSSIVVTGRMVGTKDNSPLELRFFDLSKEEAGSKMVDRVRTHRLIQNP